MPKKKPQIKDKKIPQVPESISEDFKDKYLRLAADFDNFRKRTLVERDQLRDNSRASIVLSLIPVLNNLRLALKHAPQDVDPNWLTGINHIEHQLEEALVNEGFKLICDENEMFDPNRHEAITHEESDKPEGSIIEIVDVGLEYGQKVIKPARVRVSKNKEKASEATAPNSEA